MAVSGASTRESESESDAAMGSRSRSVTELEGLEEDSKKMTRGSSGKPHQRRLAWPAWSEGLYAFETRGHGSRGLEDAAVI